MSSQSCNYCSFLRIKEEAAKTGYRKPDVLPHRSEMFTQGVDVYVGPKFIAWFAEKPTKCLCLKEAVKPDQAFWDWWESKCTGLRHDGAPRDLPPLREVFYAGWEAAKGETK